MKKHLKVLVVALSLIVVGCASSTKVSPQVIDQCKAVATSPVKSPDDSDLNGVSTPIPYTDKQIKYGVSVSEVVKNQTQNNILWEQDRTKLKNLQGFIRILKEDKIIE